MKEIPTKIKIFYRKLREDLTYIEIGYRIEPLYRLIGIPFGLGFIVGALIF